jgi:hypothetical protein
MVADDRDRSQAAQRLKSRQEFEFLNHGCPDIPGLDFGRLLDLAASALALRHNTARHGNLLK